MTQTSDSPRQGRDVPFFVVGAQRSGTTMLRLMLNSHPDLFVPFESGFITDFHAKLHAYGDLRDQKNIQELLSDISDHPMVKRGKLISDAKAILACNPRSYPELVNAIFTVEMLSKGKRRWGDKTPGYVTDLDIISRIFPGCLVIHTIRDGRDVALSNRTLNWGIHNLPRAAEDWRWKTVLGRKMGSMLGANYLEVKYEDLVLNTEAILLKICDFLQVRYDDTMLSYHKTGGKEMPAESMQWHSNSVRAPDPSLAQAWKRKMSPADRVIFEQIAGKELAEFGYELERFPQTYRSRIKSIYYAVLGHR